MAEFFETYDFYKVIGLLPAMFAILALIFGIIGKNYRLVFWGLIATGSLFLIKVLNPPFAVIFSLLQEYLPLFKQVFRWPLSKLGQIYLISLVILSTFGVIYLSQFLNSFVSKQSIRRLIILSSFVIFCIFQLIYSEYLFRGDIFPARAMVSIPQEYFELKEYLEENDQSGRIYYAPPSNNNYFRKYEWGFWGSQFISYIIPNPVMDMSSSVGSKVGEEAMHRLSNIVRSNTKEEFLFFMQYYDVKYVLFDKSIDSKGFSFSLDLDKVESLLSGYEQIWTSGNLFLYKVPEPQKKVYTESLSGVDSKNVFVKDVPRFPTLSPLEMKLKDMQIKKNEISGEFLYKGYSTYMSTNLTRDVLNSFPSKLVFNDSRLKIYPSYPYVYGDSSIKPYLSYLGNYDFFVVGKNTFDRSTLREGVTVEETFGSNPKVYAFLSNDFKSIDMMPLLLNSKGSDCSGDEVLESTFVTPQEVTSGFQLKGSTKSPCVYTSIPINTNERNILRVKINWETEENSYPGYCIFSEARKKCLNKEKFLSSDTLFGEIDMLLNTVIEKGEKISLILYSTNISKDFNSESIFRNLHIYYTPLTKALNPEKISDVWIPKEIFLDDRNTYEIRIPVVIGERGYLYNGVKSLYSIWQPSRADSENIVFEVKSSDGMSHKVEDDYINQDTNLFETIPNTKYIVYWRGENISNTPSSLCLIYNKEDKCWFQDMLASSTTSSYLNIFNSDSEQKLLNVIYSSTSYTLTTENILNEFAFMQYPFSWKGLMYTQEREQNQYVEYEMKNIFSSPHSTYYKINAEEISSEKNSNILVSIPQAKSSGWFAVARKGILFKVLGKDTRVNINDWKQAWDVSNTKFDSISVIYWPNLLSYFGYILILSFGGYLIVNLVKEKRNGKK